MRHGFGETTHRDWRAMDISRGSERVPVIRVEGRYIVSSGGCVPGGRRRHGPPSSAMSCVTLVATD